MSWTTREKVLAVALIATIITAAVFVALVVTRRIPSVGKIRTIGVDVYTDPDCTVHLEFIDWGWMNPGDLAGITCYVRNSKNVNFTLTIESGNWTPEAVEPYFTIDWNYTGEIMYPEDMLCTQITLYLSPTVIEMASVPTNFGFDILITATEYPNE